jgi:phosphoadenosine phosphosulfate reductase
MLHLASRVVPNIPVIVIDTGYLFPETYQFIEELTKKFSLNVKIFSPQMTAARQEALYGKLWEQGEEGMDKYHAINKVEPMQRALKELGVTAWLAGLRRDQSDYRANLRTVEVQDGVHKIHPILDWSIAELRFFSGTVAFPVVATDAPK